jgi:hypothetical protein
LLLAEYGTEDSKDLFVAWNELVHLKVPALVWRILQNKIPIFIYGRIEGRFG